MTGMSKPNEPFHLTSEILVRAVDGELSAVEDQLVEQHLAGCPECQGEYEEFARLSAKLEALASVEPVVIPQDARRTLTALMEGQAAKPVSMPVPEERPLKRFGWGMAIAAALALCVISVARWHDQASTAALTLQQGRAIHSGNADQQPVKKHVLLAGNAPAAVDDVAFTALPYSLDETPMDESRAVRVQMPVAALMEIGLVTPPDLGDESVQADIVMGMDGQPRAIRLVSQ